MCVQLLPLIWPWPLVYRVRSAAALMLWFAMSSSRAGTATGMLLRDASFKVLKVGTKVPVSTTTAFEMVDREGLVTE